MGITRKQLEIVIVLLSGCFLASLNQTFLSPALPSIMADMHVNATTAQWLASGYTLVEAVIIPLNAWFLGRFSPRRLFIAAMCMFGAGSLVASIAPVFGVLLLGRVMQACATGVMVPMVFTLVLLTFPVESRGGAMGIVGLIMSFAPAIGPSTSGVIVDHLGWRILFLIVVALAVLIAIAAIFFLHPEEKFHRVSFDLPSVVLLLVGMVLLLYGLATFSSGVAWISALFIAVGIVLLLLFSRRQLHLEQPMLQISVLKTRQFRTAVIIAMLLQASLIGCGLVMPLYVQNVLDKSATVTGMLMLPGALIGAACGVIAGRIFDKCGVRKVVMCGGIVMAVAGIGLSFFGYTTSILVIAIPYTIIAIGVQFIITPTNTWGINSLPNEKIQHGNAISSSFMQIGASIGTAFIMGLTAFGPVFAPDADPKYQGYMGDHIAFIGTSALLIIVFLIILLFERDKKTDKAPAAAAQPGEEVAVGAVREIRDWTVEDVMDKRCACVREDATVGQAMALLSESGSSGIPVVDADNHVVGFVSDGDVMKYLGSEDFTFTDGRIVYRVDAEDDFQERLDTLRELNVMRIATKRVVVVGTDDPLEDACRTLADKRIKKVPVVEDDCLVGTLSRRNVVRALATANEEPPEWIK